MQNLLVTPGCSVDLSRSRLGKLYDIVRCVVTSCSSDSEEFCKTNSAVRIVETTQIKIDSVQSLECYEALESTSVLLGGKDITGGLQEAHKILANLLKSSSEFSCSQRVLLRGPPGCGKTSLVQQVAYDCKAALLMIKGPEVLSSNPGESESNLGAMFDKAVRLSKEVPCVLFIDEVDCICVRREVASSSSTYRMTTALLTQLDNVCKVGGLLVVMATNSPTTLDPALRRSGRVDREVLISVPSKKQRQQILDVHMRGLPLADDVDLDRLTTITSGYVGSDLELVCTEAWRKTFHRKMSLGQSDKDMEDLKVRQADFEAALLTVKPSLQRGVEIVCEVPTVLWSDVGGLDDVKLQIQQAVEWPMLYPESYEALGLPLAKGVLLYGPPGCGKTTLAQAAANACHVTFLALSCAQLYSPYVGDSEKKVSETFQQARALAPSILFLDEIDSIVGKRSESTSSSSVSERVLSALLNEMDGVGVRLDEQTHGKASQQLQVEGGGGTNAQQAEGGGRVIKDARDRHVLVVAATNRPDMLDPALLRPGRMDRLIFVPPPDFKGRQQAFEVHTKKMPRAQDVDLNDLAQGTEGYTGADIKGVCKEAGLLALKESIMAQHVTKAHFDQAVKDRKPSLPSSLQQVQAIYRQFAHK
ncbi:hypothetical protein V1264_002330 [Littorina saxatilis]|uniref:AAA+ ATPase domain-containing protein n=2 Tax=Littorina saxatilis TaxID=31220 RepID=A0AAN9C3U0_9CAEN